MVRRELRNGSKGVEIIDSISLGEPPGDQTGVKSSVVPVGIVLGFKIPFVGDGVFSGGQID